jgi:hypothetical protein
LSESESCLVPQDEVLADIEGEVQLEIVMANKRSFSADG